MTPYYKFQYNSDSNLYAYKDLNLIYQTFGLNLIHSNENLNFHSNFSYHLFEGINERPNDFNSIQGWRIEANQAAASAAAPAPMNAAPAASFDGGDDGDLPF